MTERGRQGAHTPGRWALNYACSAKGDDPTDLTMDEGEHERYVISEHGVLVADCYADTALDFGLPDSFAEAQANARLIAAAPMLLEALQDVKADWDSWDGHVTAPGGGSLSTFIARLADSMTRVEAAILAAEGE